MNLLSFPFASEPITGSCCGVWEISIELHMSALRAFGQVAPQKRYGDS